MKNLLFYYFKRRLPIVLILLGLFMIGTIILLAQGEFISFQPNGDNTVIPVAGSTNMFLYLSIMLAVLVTLMPIFEFIFKMKRRSIDLYYSLPIKRIKLYLLKYLLGLIEIFVIFLPQWIVSFIWTSVITYSSFQIFNLSYYWLYLAMALVLGIGLYTFLSLFFTMANNLVDGIFFMVLGACFLPMIVNIVYWVLLKCGVSDNSFYMRNYFAYSPLFNYSQSIYYLMCGNFDAAGQYHNIFALILILILDLGAGFLFFFFHSEFNNAEKVSEDSDSIIGYKVMLPIYLVTGFKLLAPSALWVVIALVGYLGYCIYRRNFRLKKEDFVSLAISIVVGLLIGLFI